VRNFGTVNYPFKSSGQAFEEIFNEMKTYQYPVEILSKEDSYIYVGQKILILKHNVTWTTYGTENKHARIYCDTNDYEDDRL
jgi:hypothetical protein